MVLGTLAACILWNALSRKGVIEADEGVIRAEQIKIFNVVSSFNQFWNAK